VSDYFASDCSVELDLGSRDGREATKLILRLAAVETGEHVSIAALFFVDRSLCPCRLIC
jgi:hypothetical protein